MVHVLLAMLFVFLTTLSVTLAQEQDVEGGQDHPLLSRLPGFYLSDYDAHETECESHAICVRAH